MIGEMITCDQVWPCFLMQRQPSCPGLTMVAGDMYQIDVAGNDDCLGLGLSAAYMINGAATTGNPGIVSLKVNSWLLQLRTGLECRQWTHFTHAHYSGAHV